MGLQADFLTQFDNGSKSQISDHSETARTVQWSSSWACTMQNRFTVRSWHDALPFGSICSNPRVYLYASLHEPVV